MTATLVLWIDVERIHVADYRPIRYRFQRVKSRTSSNFLHAVRRFQFRLGGQDIDYRVIQALTAIVA